MTSPHNTEGSAELSGAVDFNSVHAQIRRVESHPAALVPEDLAAARYLWTTSTRPCIALVQRKLGIGYNYAERLVAEIRKGQA